MHIGLAPGNSQGPYNCLKEYFVIYIFFYKLIVFAVVDVRFELGSFYMNFFLGGFFKYFDFRHYRREKIVSLKILDSGSYSLLDCCVFNGF